MQETRLLQSALSPIGTLYGVGYADPATPATVTHLMQQERMLLLDIRYSPRSRWSPAWNRAALVRRYGARYRWDQRLGNMQYAHRERGIQLAPGYERGVQEAAALLRDGVSLIVLCACKDARFCHRSLIATLIHEAFARQPLPVDAAWCAREERV